MTDTLTLPVVPLREGVLFPGVTMPIGAGRPRTLKAIEAALLDPSRLVFAVSQRQPADEPHGGDLFTIGAIARIGQLQRGLAGIQLLLHGENRGVALRFNERLGYLEAVVQQAEDMAPLNANDAAFQGLWREARERGAELGRRAGLPEEVIEQSLVAADGPGRLADLIAAYTEMPASERQALLETLSVEERLRRVLVLVQRQLSVLDAQDDIKSKVREELGDRQREYVLREQMKAIQKELGDTDTGGDDLKELRDKLDALQLPPVAKKEVDREWQRLQRSGKEGMEASVIRTFLENIAELPWNQRSEESIDLELAARVLEEDHYGLDEVKDRVLEFLAVRKLRTESAAAQAASKDAPRTEADAGSATVEAEATPNATPNPPTPPTPPIPPITGFADDRVAKGPILLFAGPPGVGKTSVAQSIARAMGREYVRVALGGARDEADIRGHRRTYVGAMPGRIMQGLKQAGTKNPVFLLDEVDKLGASFQGDPASALLEVLDPAQNHAFTDHYFGVPFDLSEVLFIATANFVEQIPAPLYDRMEIVNFSGYTEAEKLAIARRYLVPRQLRENGLEPDQLAVTDGAISEIVTGWTREAGVRQLEREIGKLARKMARKRASGDLAVSTIEQGEVSPLLGRPRVHPERAATGDQVGVATGMFYTPVGGDILFVEVSTMPGSGGGRPDVTLTGKLGDVMKESARAAWSYARSHATALGIPEESFQRDVHVHVPAGAIPKDGPSAGVAMATALVSALSGRPARHDLAMTGEITLTGRVLPIGGVKEKVLGGVRAGIREFALPQDNVADLEDLTAEVRAMITVHPIAELGQLLALALRGGSFQGGRLLFTSPDLGDIPATELH